MGNLGHFLTPTGTAWLRGNEKFAVSYRENLISIFDANTGNEIEDLSFVSSSDNGLSR